MCCCSKPNQDRNDPVSGMTIEPSTRLATDPVCGMEVDPASAATAEHKGTKFYFCCQGCAMKFRAEPDNFHSRQEGPLCKC
jgi:YHS domain-containing protein